MAKSTYASGAGRRIAEARQDAGLTQDQLCRLAGISLSLLTKIETEARPVTRTTLAAVATALGTTPERLAGVYALGAVDSTVVLRDTLEDSVNRRSLISATGAAAIALSIQWAAAPPPRRLPNAAGGDVGADVHLVNWLEDNTRTLTALPTEERQHTGVLIDAHLATVTRLLEAGNHTGPVSQRLHLLAAKLSQTGGWIRFDTGEQTAARRLWTAALHAANAAGDTDLGASVLADFAYQSIWLGDPETAVAILNRTIARTSHPTALSLLHLRRARARALMGNERFCQRDLAASERFLDSASPTPAPAWCTWMSPADLAIDSGRCFLDLGDQRTGLRQIDSGLAMLDRPRAKTTAIFQTYRAEALAQSGEVEEATALLSGALDTAQRIGASRCVDLVRRAAPAVGPYRRQPDVADLLNRLAA